MGWIAIIRHMFEIGSLGSQGRLAIPGTGPDALSRYSRVALTK